MDIAQAERHNLVRMRPGGPPTVESLFLKMHLPERATSIWLRYTLRNPGSGVGEPVGSLWAIVTGPGGQRHGCGTWHINDVDIGRERFFLRVGDGELSMGRATGSVAGVGGMSGGVGGDRTISWDLTFETGGPSLVHFPSDVMYRAPFPKNKILTPHLATRFYGTVRVFGETIRVDGARGMQGHNWGPTISPFWVWVHAVGFSSDPDAVFEAVTSRIRVGPVLSPPLTLAVLRAGGRTYSWTSLLDMVRTSSATTGLAWSMATARGALRLEARVASLVERTIALDYLDSDGGSVRVENSNLAAATITLYEEGRSAQVFSTGVSATLELGGGAATGAIDPVMTC